MTGSNNPLDAVANLMRERQKYEEWMQALEARRTNSPAHVFERVQADYERRLLDVMRQLGEHSPALEEQARTLDVRLSGLAETERSQRDERSEAELRSHVGELAMDEWETLAQRSDEALAELAAEQQRIRDQLAQVRQLLVAATTPPRALTPVGNDRIESAAPAAKVAEQAPPPSAPPAAPPVAVASTVAAKAPELEHPVWVDHPAGNADSIVSVESLSSPDALTPADGATFDELEFLKSVADIPADAATRPIDPSLGIVVQDGAGANPLSAGTTQVAGSPLAANVTGNQPLVLKAETAQPKTLKCSDCGAMNYPTEWYCERCGAELAAL